MCLGRDPRPLPGTELLSSRAPQWLAGSIVQYLTAPSSPSAPAFFIVISIWTAVKPALKHTQFPYLVLERALDRSQDTQPEVLGLLQPAW